MGSSQSIPESSTAIQIQTPTRLHVASVLYFLSRVALVGFVFAVPAMYLLNGELEITRVAGGAAVVTILFIGYYGAAVGLRCAACSGPVLMDNGTRKHPHARRLPGLNHRSRVAWDILFRTSYQCMYCQTRCRSKKKQGTDPGPVSGCGAQASWQPILPARSEMLPESLGGNSLRNQHEAGPGTLETPAFAALPEVPGELDPTDQEGLPPFFPLPKLASPVPRTVSDAGRIPAEAPTMNLFSRDQPSSESANPFPAATMPALPSPAPPNIPSSVPDRDTAEPVNPAVVSHEACSNTAASAPSAGAPPWTLPAIPGTSEYPARSRPVSAAPSPPVIPERPSSLRAASPFAPQGRRGAQAQRPSAALLREVLGALEEGQRAISETLQDLVRRIESTLATAFPVVMTPPSAQTMEPLEETTGLSLPAIRASIANAVPPPLEKTTLLPLLRSLPVPTSEPVSSLPVFPQPVLPQPGDDLSPTLRRRRFARPTGATAQQLSNALHAVFEVSQCPPAPSSALNSAGHVFGPGEQDGNGYETGDSNVPAPILARESAIQSLMVRDTTPESSFPVVESEFIPGTVSPSHPNPPSGASCSSPFDVPEGPPNEPSDVPMVPAPFTFLHSKGNHFAPVGTDFDPLHDTTLPWMQPVGS